MGYKPKILCVICARGGSKGLENKNIRKLCGKPLIAYTIGHALKWCKASRVVVSTDSYAIADVAKKFGAEVPFMRPKILASDSAPKFPSVRHALKKCEKIFSERYDIIVDLDPSAPVRHIRDLDNCLEIFMKKKPLSLFSVVKARKNPYFNMVEKDDNGFFRLSKKLKKDVFSRQAAPLVYSMNAAIFFYSRNFVLDKKRSLPFSERTIIYQMDDISFDIDSILDFKFAEFLMREGMWKDEISGYI